MKLKKFFAGLLAATMLIGTMGITAFADNDPGNVTGQSILEYGEGQTPQVGLTKSVASGHGVGIPELDYHFVIEQVEGLTVRDGAPGGESKTYTVEPKPTSGDSLDIAGTVKVSPTEANKLAETQYGYSDTTDYYKLESANLLKDVVIPTTITGITDPNPNGVAIYAYRITEKLGEDYTGWTKDNNYTYHTPEPATTTEGEFNEKLVLSRAEYIMYVYTKPKADGSGRYIFAITCVQTLDDKGEEVQTVDKKNITIGGSTGIDGDFSEMEFQNDYLKTPVTDEDDPNGQPFEISKKVTGVDNDQKLLKEQTYEFDVTVTKADADDATKAIGRLWDSDDGENYYPVEFTGTGTEGVDYVTHDADSTWADKKQAIVVFTYGADGTATETVNLKNNQKITFPEVAAGTSFKVEEKDYFTETILKGKDNTTEYPLYPVVNGGDATNPRPADDATAEAKKTAVDKARVYEGATVATGDMIAAAYVNDGSKGTTPTGIIMQYLPFFVIIALAVLALIAVVIVKGRKRGMAY